MPDFSRMSPEDFETYIQGMTARQLGPFIRTTANGQRAQQALNQGLDRTDTAQENHLVLHDRQIADERAAREADNAARMAEINGLTASTHNLEGSVTRLGGRVDQVEAAVRPENIRAVVNGGSKTWRIVGAVLGGIFGLILGFAAAAKNTVTQTNPGTTNFVFANLGVVRLLVALAAMALCAVGGCLIGWLMDLALGSMQRDDQQQPRQSWWAARRQRRQQRNNLPAPAPTTPAPVVRVAA